MLRDIRNEIDLLDDQIIRLIEERFALVKKIAPHKSTLTDERREKEILSKIRSVHIQRLYGELFKLSKEIIQKA